MTDLATPGQLRWSFARWAMVTVPAIVLIGSAMAFVADSGYGNSWYAALDKPAATPPGWVFATVWPILYVLMGLSVAMILNARGAAGRGRALALFFTQLVLNFSWSYVFFKLHQSSLSVWLLALILALTIVTSLAFDRIRRVAAWLLVPYMVWLGYATVLAWSTDRMNPGAEKLVPVAARAQLGAI